MTQLQQLLGPLAWPVAVLALLIAAFPFVLMTLGVLGYRAIKRFVASAFANHETRDDNRVAELTVRLSEMVDDKLKTLETNVDRKIGDVRAVADEALALARARLPRFPGHEMDGP